MVTKTVFGIILLLMVSCIDAQEPKKNTLSMEKLKGNVKQYVESQYKPLGESENVQGIENLGLLQETTKKFNKNGFCIELLLVARGGKLKNKRFYTYNEKNELIQEAHYRPGDSISIMKNEFEYDGKGGVITQRFFEREKLETTTNYVFENARRTQKGKTQNKEGVVVSTYIVNYNENQQVIDEIRLNRGIESISVRNYYKYDESGNLRKKEHYHPVGNNFKISVFDENENEIELSQYRSGLISSYCSYVYDDKGNQTEIACDIYEKQIKKTIKSTNKYEFDEQGNWTKKVTYQEGVVTFVIERSFDYYR